MNLQKKPQILKPTKRYDIGLIGAYNFFFIYDGKVKMAIFSYNGSIKSMVPLKVKFKK